MTAVECRVRIAHAASRRGITCVRSAHPTVVRTPASFPRKRESKRQVPTPRVCKSEGRLPRECPMDSRLRENDRGPDYRVAKGEGHQGLHWERLVRLNHTHAHMAWAAGPRSRAVGQTQIIRRLTRDAHSLERFASAAKLFSTARREPHGTYLPANYVRNAAPVLPRGKWRRMQRIRGSCSEFTPLLPNNDSSIVPVDCLQSRYPRELPQITGNQNAAVSNRGRRN